MTGNDSWIYQGRQHHMWFGHGTKPNDATPNNPNKEDIPPLADRIRDLGNTLIAGLPAGLRRHPVARLNAADRDRLERVMTGVVHAMAISPRLAATRVLDRPPEAPGLAAFIEAGGVLRNASSLADLRKATDLVARSAQQMGLDRFRPFLRDADDHISDTGGLVTLVRDFSTTVASPRVSPPPVATPPAPTHPPLPPPGGLARSVGTLFRGAGWLMLAAWAVDTIGQAKREADLRETIERFHLDPANPADMAAAAAYLQARVNRSLLLGTDPPASAQDAAAEQVMRAVRADPGLWERAMAGNADALAAIRTAVRRTPNPNPAPMPKVGVLYLPRSRRERRLVDDLVAQGKSATEIAAALDDLRNDRPPAAEERRNTPGVTTMSTTLEPAGADWLRQGMQSPNGAPIPAQVAEKLAGQRFATFDDFREAFWKQVEATPELAQGFNAANQTRMRSGGSPFTLKREALPNADVWQIHHDPAISKGGPVYDLSTLRVVTPRQHRELHKGDQE